MLVKFCLCVMCFPCCYMHILFFILIFTIIMCYLFTAVEEGVGILDQILQSDNDPTNPESLVKEAAQGHTDVVKDIITRHPEQVSRCKHLPNLLLSVVIIDFRVVEGV